MQNVAIKISCLPGSGMNGRCFPIETEVRLRRKEEKNTLELVYSHRRKETRVSRTFPSCGQRIRSFWSLWCASKL